MSPSPTPTWLRRARPLLGTLVEIGIDAATASPDAAFEQAFAAILEIERCLSRFDPDSDIGRFNRLGAGARLRLRAASWPVLKAARALRDASAGIFDITQGRGPFDWQCRHGWLMKTRDTVSIDLGGIAKGHAVDRAVAALLAAGCTAGWVNAGGDLRAFGAAEVPVFLRDETTGGTRPFASVCDGALATSHFDAQSRSRLFARRRDGLALRMHASVAAPLCLWADALTKVVAATGDARHPLLVRHGAQAWIHHARIDDPQPTPSRRTTDRNTAFAAVRTLASGAGPA